MTHNFIKLQIKLIKPLNFELFIFVTVETYIKQYVFSEAIRNECHFTEYHMTLSRGRGFKNLLCLLCERIYNLMKPICVYIFIRTRQEFHLRRKPQFTVSSEPQLSENFRQK